MTSTAKAPSCCTLQNPETECKENILEDIESYLAANLSRHKLPESVADLPELPKTSSGKIKSELAGVLVTHPFGEIALMCYSVWAQTGAMRKRNIYSLPQLARAGGGTIIPMLSRNMPGMLDKLYAAHTGTAFSLLRLKTVAVSSGSALVSSHLCGDMPFDWSDANVLCLTLIRGTVCKDCVVL